jgi:uncharacterized protein
MLKTNKRPFLHAQWNDLIMANYSVPPEILLPFVPYGTELDAWEGTHYVSLVGFMFRQTKVLGISVPFHAEFEEVNLRFYVRYNDNGEWKRGVVFVKEIVPKRAISWVANALYNEHYHTMPMGHTKSLKANTLQIGYEWFYKGVKHSLSVSADPLAKPIETGSEPDFIAEHYWGFTKISYSKTSAYQVEHPTWVVHDVLDYNISFNAGVLYGPAFDGLEKQRPTSVFLANGSEIMVRNKFMISGNG